MGQDSALATSVQYGLLRLLRGSVVNATCPAHQHTFKVIKRQTYPQQIL